MPKVIEVTCPGCGAPVDTSTQNCKYCGRPVVISSMSSLAGFDTAALKKYAAEYQKINASNPDNPDIGISLALLFLKLRLFDKAKKYFDLLIEGNPENPELYFYSAISHLSGKKPFLLTRKDIDAICDLLEAANAIEEKSTYHFLLAYVKYDYFFRKKFNIDEPYAGNLERAKELGLSTLDVDQIMELIGQDCPQPLEMGE